MNFFRSAKVMNKAMIVNPFSSNNSNIANTNTQHCQIMATLQTEF